MRQKSLNGAYSLPYTVRPERTLFVFILVLGMLILLPSLLIFQRGSSAILPIITTILVICLLWGFIATLMLNFGLKIVLLPDRICYHTFFSRQEKLFADITRAEIDRVLGKGFRMYQYVRATQYILKIDDRFSNKPLLINIKPFSKRNLSIIIDAIATHASSVTMDESVRRLREGTFNG